MSSSRTSTKRRRADNDAMASPSLVDASLEESVHQQISYILTTMSNMHGDMTQMQRDMNYKQKRIELLESKCFLMQREIDDMKRRERGIGSSSNSGRGGGSVASPPLANTVQARQQAAAVASVNANNSQIAANIDNVLNSNISSERKERPEASASTAAIELSDAAHKEARSDKGQELGDALIYLATHNHFQSGQPLDAAPIPKSYNNASKLKHCLTFADFVGDENDIAMLLHYHSEKEEEEDITENLQLAASNIVSTISRTLLEGEEGENNKSSEGNKKKRSRAKGTTILGLCKGIMNYRNRIKRARGLDSVENVPLICLEELEELENK